MLFIRTSERILDNKATRHDNLGMLSSDVRTYNDSQSKSNRKICELLCETINQSLLRAKNKLWHGAPVWFLEDNPIVGYDVLKDCVRLLFWSGQSFDESGLSKNGSFKAAEARYTSSNQINVDDLKRWVEKSVKIQWDYKNIVKRRGKLERLKI